jgi:hypothetical protein
MNDRTTIINETIRQSGYTRYLEVGVRNPADNYHHISCAHRQGVDINPIAYHGVQCIPSADFFARRRRQQRAWDCIFIDGDHREAGVRADVTAALSALMPGGCILMHDCRPMSPDAILPEKPAGGRAWNGQAWRVFLELRQREDLMCVCVDTDHGVGVVWERRPGIPYQPLPAAEAQEGMQFSSYFPQRHKLLHLVSLRDFITLMLPAVVREAVR